MYLSDFRMKLLKLSVQIISPPPSLLKVFVANPNKTQPVMDILLKNQTKLVEFLSHFQTDRSEDEQFCDEKNYLIKQIRDLKRPAAPEEA